jgi:phage shock protein A
MGILDRINMIVKSNVNDFLDKAANPRKDIDLYIYDMGDGIKEAEQNVTDTLVQINMLKQQAGQARQQVNEWGARAEKAVRAGRDDLAMEALRQQKKFEEEAVAFEEQFASQEQNGREIRARLEELKQKYEDLQRNKANYIARWEMAKAANTVTGTRDPVTGLNQGDYARMERRIMGDMARAEMDLDPAAAAQAEIDSLGGGTGGNGGDTLDEELKALKDKMGYTKKSE